MKSNYAIILLLLSIGLFYTFTRAQYQEVKRLYALASEYDNALESVAATIELRDRLMLEYEQIPKAEVDRLNKVLPDNIDNVRLALDLDSIAARHGVAVKNFQMDLSSMDNQDLSAVALPEYAKPYDKATLSFSFISNYDNFKRLLADIERSLRVMDIKSAAFQVGESDLYSFQLSVDTYWLK